MQTYNPIVNRTDTFNFFLRNIRQQKLLPLTKEERKKLVDNIIENDTIENRQKLAEHNLNYVVHLAKSQNYRHLDIMDLVQEGNLGLCEAMNAYDPHSGYEFTTFATSHILRRIYEYVNNNKTIIPSDKNHEYLKKKYYEFLTKFYNMHGHLPNELEIEEHSGFTPLQLQNIKNYVINICFLDEPIEEDSNTTLAQTIPSPVEEYSATATALEKICNKYLSETDADILLSHYGIGRYIQSNVSLGEKYNVSEAVIANKIRKAINTLKEHKKEIRNFLNNY